MKLIQRHLAICFLIFLFSGCIEKESPSEDIVPQDVQRFQKKRDLCDHFRGEEGYDQDRQKFLAEQMKTNCTGTDNDLKTLKLKYQGNKTISDALNRYEERIE